MATKINIENSRLFKDLIEYTKLPPELVSERCRYAAIELAVMWHRKKNIEEFYKSGELYLFDLTKYQLLLEHHNHIRDMIGQIKELNAKKILEFGGGIGEFSIICCENNIDITYYDLDGEIRDYALWRFKKHNCGSIKIPKEYPLDEKWDVINAMDVVEHLKNPEEIISQLTKNSRYIFCNPQQVKYNVFFPQHISKFDLSNNFELVKGYLWKSKRFEE